MIHSKLGTLDLAVVAAYAVVLLAIGLWVSFRRKGAEDPFLAGRSLGWFTIGLSIFGANSGPTLLIASCGAGYGSGIVTANFDWLAWYCLLLLGMVFVPHYMRTGISTMPQFLLRRFGPSCHEFLAWYTLFSTAVWLGLPLYAGGVLLSQIMDWPLWVSVSVLMAIAASFTVTGGLAAVAITDCYQSILILAGAAALTIIALSHVGGIRALADGVPPDYWRLVRPASDSQFPWPAMFLGYPVVGIWYWCTSQTMVQRVLGARDLRQGQLATVFMGYLKIVPPLLFILPGIACRVLHPNLRHQDEAFATLATNYLPTGLAGLMIVVLVAGTISATAGGLNSFSTVLTLDMYRKKFHPAASDGELHWVGRLTTIAIAGVSIAWASLLGTFDKDILNLTQAVISFLAPPLAVVFLMGVLWRRATATAAIWSLALGSIVSVSVGWCHMSNWPSQQFWPHYMMVSVYLFVGTSLGMAVLSLMTHKSATEGELPTLGDTCARQGGQSRLVWALWGLLAAIMLTLYICVEAVAWWLGSGL